MKTEDPSVVAARFALAGPVEGIELHGLGNINLTYLVTCRTGAGDSKRYLVQRINPFVFAEPEVVMANMVLVTAHLRGHLQVGGGDVDRRVMSVVPTLEGDLCWQGKDGAIWRCVVFVERAHSRAKLDTEAQAFEAGRAFGELHRLLLDLDPALVGETIPGFHDPPARLDALERVLRADPVGHSVQVGAEIDNLLGRRDLAEAGRRLVGPGVPRRVAHNDAKVDNLLFDDYTDKVVCITDLDTVMPGSVLWDVGDLLRSGACPASEDERDLDRVVVDMGRARTLLAGYHQEAAAWMTPTEVRLIPLSCAVVVYEQALRFLTDHLAGDVYFRVFRPDQNLDRCRAQIVLLESMLRQIPTLERVVATAWEGEGT